MEGSLGPIKCIEGPTVTSTTCQAANNENIHLQQTSGNNSIPGFLQSQRERSEMAVGKLTRKERKLNIL